MRVESENAPVSVLVVEDQLLLALEIEQNLERAGFSVCGRVPDGESAVERARSLRPDLVLMDIGLSGALDGIEAAQHVRGLGIPVIFLTAYSDERTVDRAIAADPYGYLVKPFSEAELRAAVQLALRKHERERSSNGRNGSQPHADVHQASAAESAFRFDELARTPTEGTSAYDALSSVPFFKDVGRVLLQKIAQTATVASFRSREVVAPEEGANVRGFLVLTGSLGLVKTSPSGRELIVESVDPGDLLGFAMALGAHSYPVRIKALRDSTVVWFSKESVERLVASYPSLSHVMLSQVTDRLTNAYSIARALAHDNVPVRVAATLLTKLDKRQADPRRPQVVAMTRQELADTVGTTLESAVRATRAMEEDGIVDLSRRGRIIISDQPRLEDIARAGYRVDEGV
ncbi:MAG: response regulator [Bdellovibrionales bacterium]|nr:response regulator [Bdellovibrionales bacterium]